MTEKPKRVRGVRRDCTCTRARHQHGTFAAYREDRCSCDACREAAAARQRAYVETRTGQKVAPRTATVSPGQFVVTFPYHGGWSKEHLRRTGDLRARQLASEQGVELTGPLSFRLDRTPTGGWLLVVQAPAKTFRPLAEVSAGAEHFAYEHAEVAPHLSAWADQHAQKASAPRGRRVQGVAA